ncbi:hypothetical protein [Natrinema sp. 1APR25-10V2]|nr:hypothetical protein [Natrinema sp. 1APR25-10V2]
MKAREMNTCMRPIPLATDGSEHARQVAENVIEIAASGKRCWPISTSR